MPAIYDPTELYCSLDSVAPVPGSNAIAVGFKLSVVTGPDVDPITTMIVLDRGDHSTLDAAAASAHETLAAAFEIAAKILRREASRYQ